MAKTEVNAVFYAADLDDLRRWVGSKDQKRFQQAWAVLREDDETEWDPEEVAVLERLLKRMVFEGQLYEGLAVEERYYLTQLLIDLFDEYADPDALTEDLPLTRLLQVVDGLPKGSPAARLAGYLVRGRELNGDGLLWTSGPAEEALAFYGYVRRDEAAALVSALDETASRGRERPSGLWKQLRNAAEECARAELDLVSFVG